MLGSRGGILRTPAQLPNRQTASTDSGYIRWKIFESTLHLNRRPKGVCFCFHIWTPLTLFLAAYPGDAKVVRTISLRFSLTPVHNPVSDLLSTEGFQLRSFWTCSIYFERVFLFLRRPFWKGAPYFECTEVWGAVSRHDHCRQQQPTTNYVALCSTFNAWNIPRENSNTRWRIDIDACVHPLTSPANLVFFFARRRACCSLLCRPFLSGSPKRANPREDIYWNLSEKRLGTLYVIRQPISTACLE